MWKKFQSGALRICHFTTRLSGYAQEWNNLFSLAFLLMGHLKYEDLRCTWYVMIQEEKQDHSGVLIILC